MLPLKSGGERGRLLNGKEEGEGERAEKAAAASGGKGGRDALKVEEEGGKGRGEIALGGGTSVDGSYSSSSPG